MSFEDALRKAVVDCINQNVLKEFLENHKREVISMLTQEWDWGKAVEVAKREAVEDKQIAIAKRMKAKGMGLNEIAEMTDLTVDDILRL